MNQRSRSTLFLIEQLIVVAVFAICSAACVRILASAFITARESRDKSYAVLAAESAAESFKATAGDLGRTAVMLGAASGYSDADGTVTVFYDRQWHACGSREANYRLRLVSAKPETPGLPLSLGEITVETITGESLLAITVAAR